MRKVLIPTDFSKNAWNAIKYAVELFKYEVSEFYIMHAYKDEIYEDKDLLQKAPLDSITQIVGKKSEEFLNKTLLDISEYSSNPKHKYNTISSNNLLIDEVELLSNDEDIDLIVMGTHGKTNDRNITFGSNTLQVLKYVQCPVLAVPANYEYNSLNHIVFTTNYMIPYNRRELKLLSEMASKFSATIDMLYISKSKKLSMRQQDHKNFIKDAFDKNNINFKTLKNKNILNTIFSYLKGNSVDLLVMVNTTHSFLENILFQSTIDKISLNIDIPFLTLQNIKRY